MYRPAASLLCFLTLAAAADAASTAKAPAVESLPLPPLPPVNVPGYEAAPVANENMRAPQVFSPQGIELVPRLYRKPDTQSGLGYTPGSAFREPDSDRLNRLGPGFNLKVPLN